MNSTKIKPQTLKGFRDFLPETMIVRNYVKNILIEVFETFGFQPVETPTLEYASTLMGKYGEEADKLVYSFKDAGDRQVGLRYDLTVPTAKVLSIYQNQISLPFKRYQIQPVYRADKPQRGRYREFLQCDVDIFGPESPINDAEIIALTYTILEKLNFKKYSIRINSRQVLYQILDNAGIKNNQKSALQSLDKYQKIGEDGVKNDLISKDIDSTKIDKLFDYIKKAQPDDYLKSVFEKIKEFGVPKSAYIFDPTMIRGLDYYTSTIFETYVTEPKMGSITGGGRYDNLISSLGGPQTPAVGTTIGLDRIVDCILELNLLPELNKTTTKVLVANFGVETEKESINLLNQLRNNDIASTFYPTPDKIGKQIKYADSLSIPYVAMIGTDEIKNSLITLKNLKTTEQKLISLEELLKFLL
ncbi:MAG: histidine--tRNA ligase [Candidatus Shapirobacteria bacterium]|nr:histidine--tRNA ligase [Candidatus Shapirobacteria bacterium]